MARETAAKKKPKTAKGTTKGVQREPKGRPKGAAKAPRRKPAGRPSKLTKEVHERIVSAVAKGCPLVSAAAAAGIGHTTVKTWMQKGETQKSGGYAAFRADVVRARDVAVGQYVEMVNEAAVKDHRAAAWMLARLDPNRWGDPGKRHNRAQEDRILSAQVSKAEAEARLVEAKAKAAQAMAAKLESGDGALDDVIALLDESDARDIVMAAVRAVDRPSPSDDNSSGGAQSDDGDTD